MKPVGFDSKKGILQQCIKCGQKKYNKLQANDNFDTVIALSVAN